MTASNFERSMPHVLAYEGKFSNHKADPGGRTYEGITQRVWDGYSANNRLPVRQLSENTGSWKDWPKHRNAIYRRQYWDAVKGDDLPSGIDFVLFDGAVNSGPSQSIKWLQRALRLNKVDGMIGEATLAAVQNHPDHDKLVADVIAKRLAFLQALKTWPTFGKGWGARLTAVKKTGQAWASGSVGPAPVGIPDAGAKAPVEDAKPAPSTAAPDAMAGAGGGAATIGVSIEAARDALTPYATSSEFIGKVVATLVVAGVLLGIGGAIWRWYATRRAAELKVALS